MSYFKAKNSIVPVIQLSLFSYSCVFFLQNGNRVLSEKKKKIKLAEAGIK